MQIVTLKRICEVLDGSSVGQWLTEQLQEFPPNDSTPAVLVSASSDRDREEVIPKHTELMANLTVLHADDTSDCMQKAVSQNDLWIWVMSAMKILPAAYVVPLKAAREDQLPIWAVVTRLERLNDPSGFHSRINENILDQLPTGSRVVTAHNHENVPLSQVISEMISVEGVAIAEDGRKRRTKNLIRRLAKQNHS
jgi:hypothetical protein